ncbi:regulatory protein RecX [Glaciibacter sp. 2TAF33]|uniref:regulatory protein RecX n=1 Tax=Glaciibacter sp. 2TAF33 TaxID=3233015 RepID=UPI003F912E7A
MTYLPGAAPGMKRRSPLSSPRDGEAPADAVPIDAVPISGAPRKPAISKRTTPVPFDAAEDYDPEGFEAELDDADESTDAPERAEKLLLARLRGRSLSRVEAEAVLRGADLDEVQTEEMLDRFTELHYLDEAKLADQILHSHHERKGLGRTGVELEMRRRKLDPNVILDKLEEIPDDEEERAIELAVKRVQQLARFDEQTIDRRLTGFLMRKGYNSSIVRVAVKAALASRGGSGGGSKVRFR